MSDEVAEIVSLIGDFEELLSAYIRHIERRHQGGIIKGPDAPVCWKLERLRMNVQDCRKDLESSPTPPEQLPIPGVQ